MSETCRILGYLATALAVAGPAVASGAVAIDGSDQARMLPPRGAVIEDYENAGYRLRIAGDEVLVTVDAGDLSSRSPFTAPRALPKDPISRLARALTLDSETQYEAVSRILSWVARSISYDLDRDQPQDALAVLTRRRGYCTGVARLTVALLRATGLPAREVAGYVVDAGDGSGSGYHRWIETFLPDRGWVFSDPLRSHHYVPATYLRLASDKLTAEDGLDGLLLDRKSALVVVDVHRPGAPGVSARRNSTRQLAATLHVRVESLATGSAELTGGSLRRTRSLDLEGETTFVGLEPGPYTLRLKFPAGTVERAVEFPDRIRRSIVLAAPPGTSGRHRARPSNGVKK